MLVTLTVLASIGLVEYILSRPEGGRDANARRAREQGSARGVSEAEDLRGLGNVLDGYGRGMQPDKRMQPAENTATAVSVGGSPPKAR